VKEQREWHESYIQSFIDNGIPESLILEFKASEALRNKGWKNEFAKDVSAFANSAGGTLIYGVRENKDTHEAESIDEGFDALERKKEQLEQVINSNVQRRIEGIEYHTVPLTTKPNRVLFVIHVPQSRQSPHMSNNRYYKRFQFESVYMEEYEVRERYDRITFPGKDVVEAWRDDAINPLIRTMEDVAKTLRNDRWTWNHVDGAFAGLDEIGKQGRVSDNAEDFISRHSGVADLMNRFDVSLISTNSAGKVLFERVAKSSNLRAVFLLTTSEEALSKLASENATRFKSPSATEVRKELLGNDWSEQDRFNYFAEWAINGAPPPHLVEPMRIFWHAFGDQFRNLVLDPPLNELRQEVEHARQELLEISLSLMIIPRGRRKELSERHNIPVQAPRHPDDYYGLNVGGFR
jgi:hypothetical protein